MHGKVWKGSALPDLLAFDPGRAWVMHGKVRASADLRGKPFCLVVVQGSRTGIYLRRNNARITVATST